MIGRALACFSRLALFASFSLFEELCEDALDSEHYPLWPRSSTDSYGHLLIDGAREYDPCTVLDDC